MRVVDMQRAAVSEQRSGLLDQFGRPIGAAARPDPERLTLASIRDLWYAYPAHGLTPERLAAILKEADQGDVARQAELFEEMLERDGKLCSLFQTRRMAVEGLDWRIEPADDSAQAKALAEEATEQVEAMTLRRVIAHLLTAVPHGYGATELLWSGEGRALVIRDVVEVPQRRLTYLPRAGEPMPAIPRLLTDQEPVFGIDLPAWKFVVHRYRAAGGSAIRAGLMRTCAWLYLFKHYDIKDWAAFLEVYGMPLRLGKYQPGASKEDRDALLLAVRSIGHDAAGIISSSTEIEFIEAIKTASADIFERFVNLLNKEMAQAVLGQTLTSDVGSVGSLAAAQVHDEVRFDLMEADATALAETITTQILRPLVGFNHGWDVPVPRFAFEIEEPRDQGQEATTLKTLVEAGFGPAIPLAVAQERFGIRAPKDGEATVGGQRSAVSHQPSALKTLALAQQAVDADVIAEQAPVDALAIDAVQNWQSLVEPLLAPVRAIIEGSATLEEARGRLLSAYPEMDDAAVTELLARAIFAADAWGRVHA
ncbi:MAG: DUF935 domain-containing protein [Candidatus Methylomirabilis oxyfera]|nr:DUF935 domain-containing protein [Candidatus Methylomirabilis oxyfera]